MRYQLKTPYRDGTTHVISNHWISLQGWPPRTEAQSQPNPLPRVCTNSRHRALVTPAKRAGATRSGWLMNRQHQHNGERR
ncbi:hypothetical protein ECZU29_59420 [Escherichia coli]|nr:hypothetical protein ECZU29_59420 [Escherichia coli]